jgi:hypothetical protein
MKKFLHFLQLRDGIWSIPVAIFLFWIVGILLEYFFGFGTGSYDPAFIQPLFLAVIITLGATNAANIGLWFNFRGIHRYLYGYKNDTGKWINQSKDDWQKINPLYRLLLTLFVLFFFIALVVIVYSKLV